MRCLIVDDEPLALDLLESYISNIPFLTLVARCDSPEMAAGVLHEQPVDLIFSDIEMPGMNGLELIQSLQRKPMFILVTAYKKYALQGYVFDIVDYLLKPVTYQRFLKAAIKAHEIFQLRQPESLPEPHKAEEPVRTPRDFVFLYTDYSYIKVMLEDIMLVEAFKDYAKFHLADKKPILVRMSMKAAEELLPSNLFFRIHKSYIAALRFIQVIRKTEVVVDGKDYPLSDAHRDGLLRLVSG